MNRIVATMDDLPELPFEKVLSYLNLRDRLKARAVSRGWRSKFDRYPVNTLCCSSRPRDFIWGKSRWVSGAFAKNFISSTRFTSFFDTFGQTILSTLKHLRLCDIGLSERNRVAFTRTLNSFDQLEELDIIGVRDPQPEFELNLPMLTSLYLESVHGIEKLTLEAPRLRDVKILYCSGNLRVDLVHGESVERLLVDRLEHYIEVKNLKNLQYLCVNSLPAIDPTLLSSLQHLKEIHTNYYGDVSELFEQKQRSGRADLKIYLCGLLLNGPDDPGINAFRGSSLFRPSKEALSFLAENRSRLADQIPFCISLEYSNIEAVAPGLEVDLLKRFTDLNKIIVTTPVQDTQRFLDLLKNCSNIVDLTFQCDQPQDLFDGLPEHCAVQRLWMIIFDPPSDQDFLFRLKHLNHLYVSWSIDRIETVRRAFEELPVLSSLTFEYDHKASSIRIDQYKQLHVSFFGNVRTVSSLNAAIEFIVENNQTEAAQHL